MKTSILSTVLSILLLHNVWSDTATPTQEAQTTNTDTPAEVTQSTTTPSQTTAQTSPDSDIKLYPNDSVRIEVLYEKEFLTNTEVSSTGFVNLPYIGDIKLAGITVQEAQDLIAARLIEEEIFVSPQVNIDIIKHAERFIRVTGQVNKPGPIAIPLSRNSLTLSEVISGAHDITRIANPNDVQIRKTDPSGRRYAFKVNYKKIRASTKIKDVDLVEGDEVFVPESIF